MGIQHRAAGTKQVKAPKATSTKLEKRLQKLPLDQLQLMAESYLMDSARMFEMYRRGGLDDLETRRLALAQSLEHASNTKAVLQEILSR